jgi:hypothetical protein
LPALLVGRVGLVVIDCDRHHGGSDGIEAFNRLVSTNGGNLADVPMTKTARGGAHLFFKQPKGKALGNGRGELPVGIDVRGVGGFVIAPGAVLPDGKRWQAVNGRPLLAEAFKAGTIPELPQWLADIIRPNRKPNSDALDEYARTAFSKTVEATDGLRGQAYAAAAVDGAVAELSGAPTGKRNEMLNAMAFRLGRMIARGWVDEKTVADALLGACDANEYLREHGHRDTMKTIESGIEAGRKESHPDLPDREPFSGDDGTPLLTFLTFPPHGALSKEPPTRSKRAAGRRKLAPGRSQIGRCSMTGGASCRISRLKHCPPRCAAGFFAQPVARL